MKTPPTPEYASQRRQGFTLIELMLSVAILAVMVLMLTSVLSNMQNVVARSQAQVEEFEDARLAFESMSRKISQTTLNSYWGYVYDDPKAANPNPKYYTRLSDLHYTSDVVKNLVPTSTGNGHAVFFQAMLGDVDTSTSLGSTIAHMQDLLNCWGYYIDYKSDLDTRPAFMKTGQPLLLNPERKRFRLMEFRQPPDVSILFDPAYDINNKTTRKDINRWFTGPFKSGSGTTADYSVPIADNILALVIVPYIYVNTGGTTSANSVTDTRKKQSYEYDTRLYQWRPSNSAQDVLSSKNQPPAMLELTLVATDEKSYDRLVQREGDEGAAAKVRDIFKGLLTNGTNFSQDLNKPLDAKTYDVDVIEQRMRELDIHYKIFTTTVPLRASKWITEREKL